METGDNGARTLRIRGILARLGKEQILVMQHVAEGQTYEQIGRELGLCEMTVTRRVASVCRAIGASNRVEAVALLVAHGVIRPPGT